MSVQSNSHSGRSSSASGRLTGQKEFRIEKLMKARPISRSNDGNPDDTAETSKIALVAHLDTDTILERIDGLYDRLDQIEIRSTSPSEAGDDADVRIEIARLVKEIGRTKAELATLRHPLADEEQDQIVKATNELDAIVEATEVATDEILRSSEEINQLLDRLRREADVDEELREIVDQIEGRTIRILEACNFQDITGQRINKVVNAMKFIEDRVKAMIDIWGVEAFADLPLPDEDHEDEDAKLLEGPQLENQGLTQDDIDALFD